MSIIKLVIGLAVVGVVVAVAFGGYIAAVVLGPLQSDPQPPTVEEVAEAEAVEGRIEDEVSDSSAFLIQLSDEELTALLRARAAGAAPVRSLAAAVDDGEIAISGSLNGAIGVPFSASVSLRLERGQVQIDVDRVSMGPAPLPGAVREELQPLIDQAVDVNELLRSAGATQIQSVVMEDGFLTIAGIQAAGQLVSDAAAQAMAAALESSGGSSSPIVPGLDVVPPGRIGSGPGDEVFLALGDSLAANVGVSSPLEGYVSRFHSYVERETGRQLGLVNLGVSGESTISIHQQQLPAALEELDRLRNDGDPATRVSVLTLDLGANDLLGHLASPSCRQDIRGDACAARLDSAIVSFGENYAEILDTLADRIEPDTEFYVMTIYNPFDFGIGIPFEADSNDVVERMNEIIAVEAERVGAIVADAYTPMSGNAAAWTHMLSADIHPTAQGYQALAYSFALARTGQ